MQDPSFENEAVEFEVKPRTPRLPGKLLGLAAAGLAIVVVAGLVGAALIGAAASSGDLVARVMPSNVMAYFSLTTHPDRQPDFVVVAQAWRGSKEAKQIEDALNSALTFAGFDWEKDILPWLGDRVAVGVVDLGGFVPPTDASSSETGYYRSPFILLAAHTRDRARSDAFLADFRAQRESSLGGGSAIFDEVYRGVSLVYVANDKAYAPYGEAYATIDDVLVLAAGGRDDLKLAIDAALDGTNLAAAGNFQETMAVLPGSGVATFYLDYARYFEAIETMMTRLTDELPDLGDTDLNQRFQEQRRRQQEQMAQLRQMMQAFGGAGAVMRYDPGGVRFDFAMQYFPERFPESVRSLANFDIPAAPNRVFDAIPAEAVMAFNMTNPSASWGAALTNPDWLELAFGGFGGGEKAAEMIAKLQTTAGVDLSADLFDLLNGEMAFVALPAPPGDGQRLPLDAAVMLDASDPDRAARSLDNLVDALVQALPVRGLQRQPLSGLPYTVLTDGGDDVLLAYGVIGGRLVVGTGSSALLALETAGQEPLSDDDAFRSATAVLPAERVASGFVRMQPLRDLLALAYGRASECGPCNYLQPIDWISVAGEMVDKDAHLQRGTLYIALQPAK